MIYSGTLTVITHKQTPVISNHQPLNEWNYSFTGMVKESCWIMSCDMVRQSIAKPLTILHWHQMETLRWRSLRSTASWTCKILIYYLNRRLYIYFLLYLCYFSSNWKNDQIIFFIYFQLRSYQLSLYITYHYSCLILAFFLAV